MFVYQSEVLSLSHQHTWFNLYIYFFTSPHYKSIYRIVKILCVVYFQTCTIYFKKQLVKSTEK